MKVDNIPGRITFKRNRKYVGSNAVGCSPEIYEKIADIAEKSGERMKDVADKLLDFALSNVTWID